MHRCALYLRAMATRGERLELFPAAVYPEVDRTWMMDHVADVLEANGEGMHSLGGRSFSLLSMHSGGCVMSTPLPHRVWGQSSTE